jgi:hypothetical protein
MIRLTDEQWERIRKHFPEEHIPDGRPGREPIPTRDCARGGAVDAQHRCAAAPVAAKAIRTGLGRDGLDGKFARFLALENAINISSLSPKIIGQINALGQLAADFSKGFTASMAPCLQCEEADVSKWQEEKAGRNRQSLACLSKRLPRLFPSAAAPIARATTSMLRHELRFVMVPPPPARRPTHPPHG